MTPDEERDIWESGFAAGFCGAVGAALAALFIVLVFGGLLGI